MPPFEMSWHGSVPRPVTTASKRAVWREWIGCGVGGPVSGCAEDRGTTLPSGGVPPGFAPTDTAGADDVDGGREPTSASSRASTIDSLACCPWKEDMSSA